MPLGRPGSICRIFCLTRSITSRAFSPWRMTMMPAPASPVPSRSEAPRRLSGSEEQQVLDLLNSERFADRAVPEVHATLLDEGISSLDENSVLVKNSRSSEGLTLMRDLVVALPEGIFHYASRKYNEMERWVKIE